MFNYVVPHLQIENVSELTPERLRGLGYDALLLDVDCTLKRYRSTCLDDGVLRWLEGLRAAGIRLCLVSNGRGKRIGRLAESLGLPFLASACKPFPYACRAAVARMGLDPARTAMVGDQLFADVMAARWAGLGAILVQPMHPEEEPWYTRLKRPLETFFLRWLIPRLSRRAKTSQ